MSSLSIAVIVALALLLSWALWRTARAIRNRNRAPDTTMQELRMAQATVMPEGGVAMAIDPVCKMQVDEKKAPGGKSDYKGKTYYFCAPGCKRSFDKDPAKYVKG